MKRSKTFQPFPAGRFHHATIRAQQKPEKTGKKLILGRFSPKSGQNYSFWLVLGCFGAILADFWATGAVESDRGNYAPAGARRGRFLGFSGKRVVRAW